VEIGFDFISRLDDAVRTPDAKNDLLSLYLNYFEPVNTQKFAEKDWPACFEIEGIHPLIQPPLKIAILMPKSRLSITSSDFAISSKK
jgi:hypothetical protein